MNKRELGRKGEEIAADFLREQGYQLIEENFWSRYGEIDLIAYEDDELVFIEVKSVTRSSLINPKQNINYLKKKHLERVARYYLLTEATEGLSCRFDIIAISKVKADCPKIELIRNAFLVDR